MGDCCVTTPSPNKGDCFSTQPKTNHARVNAGQNQGLTEVALDQSLQKSVTNKRPGDEGLKPKGAKKPKGAPEKPLLACPFHKHNPFSNQKCGQATIKENTDMRRHLQRYHMQPVHCPICKIIFGCAGDDDSIRLNDEHVKEQNCKPTDTEIPGITPDKWDALQRCEKGPGSKERSWFATWDILFPDTPRPATPYLTISHVVEDAIVKFLDQLPSEEMRSTYDPALKAFMAFFQGHYETSPAGAPAPTARHPSGCPGEGTTPLPLRPPQLELELPMQAGNELHLGTTLTQGWPCEEYPVLAPRIPLDGSSYCTPSDDLSNVFMSLVDWEQ